MTFDVVWYTPQHKQKALASLKRLDPEELSRRRLAAGVTFIRDVPIPQADKPLKEGEKPSPPQTGRVAFCSHYGTHGMTYEELLKWTMWEEIEPGYTVGNFRPEYFETEEVQEREAFSRKNEADIEAKIQRRQAEEKASRSEAYAEAQRRYYVAVGHIMKVEKPAKLKDQELADIAVFAALLDKEIPPIDEYLSVVVPPEQAPSSPPGPDFGGDIEAQADFILSQIVQRKERTV